MNKQINENTAKIEQIIKRQDKLEADIKNLENLNDKIIALNTNILYIENLINALNRPLENNNNNNNNNIDKKKEK
jgi:cell division protein FtsB